MQRIANLSGSHWSLDHRVHPMTVGTFLDCVTELCAASQGLIEKRPLFDDEGGWRVLQSIVRQLSVPLRKLCLDDNGALLKKVIANPSFHPLGGNKGIYRRATISWRTERREWVLRYANGKQETVIVPETEHAIEIGRLYGVDFLEDGWCTVQSPFDLDAPRIPLDAWLKVKALQVNSVSYSVGDALGLVANYEGAHTNELPAFVGVGVNPEDIDKGRNMKYRLINCVYFGCLSYAHILAMYSALYIIQEARQLLDDVAEAEGLKDLHASALARTIREIRTDLSFRARIVNATHEMVVAGKSNLPRSRRREPVYRLWSGSREWDAPVGDAAQANPS